MLEQNKPNRAVVAPEKKRAARALPALFLLVVGLSPVRPSTVSAQTAPDAGPPCTPSLAPEIAPTHFASCRTDADCVVELASCCPPCGWARTNLYRAIHRTQRASFARHACPQRFSSRLGGVGCPACAGGPPRGLRAVCAQNVCRMRLSGAHCGEVE